MIMMIQKIYFDHRVNFLTLSKLQLIFFVLLRSKITSPNGKHQNLKTLHQRGFAERFKWNKMCKNRQKIVS